MYDSVSAIDNYGIKWTILFFIKNVKNEHETCCQNFAGFNIYLKFSLKKE